MRLLIIDLSGVSFCDVSALAMLDGAQRHSTWLGITVRRAAPPPDGEAAARHRPGPELHDPRHRG
jgi:hypothetical protein